MRYSCKGHCGATLKTQGCPVRNLREDVRSGRSVAAVLTGILGAVLGDLALDHLHFHDDAA
jgi:hypothetical protein